MPDLRLPQPTNQQELSSRRLQTAKYMRIIALSGFAIVAVTIVTVALLPVIPLAPWLLILMFAMNCSVLGLLYFDRVETAMNLFAAGAFIFIAGASAQNYDTFQLMLTGLVILILGTMIFLPNGHWQMYFLISMIFLFACNAWYLQEAKTETARASVIYFAMIQTIIFLAGAASVMIAYRLLTREDIERKRSIERLRENQLLLERRSAELQASNEAVMRSESRYRTLVESATEAIFLCQFPSWRIVDANAAAAKLLKLSREELLQIDVIEFTVGTAVGLDGEISDEDFYKTLNSGKLLVFEQLLCDTEGHAFMCQVRMIKLPEEENHIRVTVVDISEQRAVADRERELAERMELVSDNIPVQMVYVDADLNLQFWNKSYGEMHGIEHQVPPMHAANAFSTELFNIYQPYFVGALNDEVQEFESITVHRDNQVTTHRVTCIPHRVGDQVMGIFAVTVDITAEINAQRELVSTSEFLQLVADNMPARLSYMTTDGNIRFLNKRYEQLGVDPITSVGLNPIDVMQPQFTTGMDKIMETVLTGNEAKVERRINGLEGEERIENIVAVPHFGEDDDVVGFIVLVSDVTEQRKAEEALQQAQKVESLGVLAGGIAHDFNNLLVAILGQTTIAKAKLDDDHRAKRHVIKAIQASERASTLTNQMLAYSGRGAFSISPLHLNKLIEENLELFRVSVPQTTSFTTSLATDLPLVDADSAQMQQVIMNLIINAGQAIGHQPGTINVSTKVCNLSETPGELVELTDSKLNPGQYIVVSIGDTGAGMDADTRRRIFDPFYTTKETGSGLGLAAVLGIVRGHHGGIAVKSEVGHGTTFELYFPVSAVTIFEAPKSAEFSPNAQDLQTCTVMVIDDEPSVSALVVDTLALEEITAVEFNEPLAGIEYYKAHASTIDLVILDLMMPNMNGMQVYEELKAINPQVRVLLSSGYSREDVVNRFVMSGVTGFIQKPYNFQQLLSQVHNALTRPLS